MERPKVRISGFDIEWDLEKGLNLWAGTPTLSMWIPTTVAGLLSGLQRMVGTERFDLCMQQGGIESTEGDWGIISSASRFEDGWKLWADIAFPAGWGLWELVSLDREKCEARIRTTNSWEGMYQRSLGVCWGSGMSAGKASGIFGRLFGVACWAQQVVFSAKGGEIDEFVISPSDKTIDQRLDELVLRGAGTSADLAAALTRLQIEIAERQRSEEELRRTLELTRRQEEALRTLTTPIIQIWDSVLTMPVMGQLDGDRAAVMMERLLAEIVSTRARYALIDLTGVETVDTSTADHLVRIVRAIELLGAKAVITGIRAAVAQTVVALGMDLNRVATLRNLQQGLRACIRWMDEERQGGGKVQAE